MENLNSNLGILHLFILSGKCLRLFTSWLLRCLNIGNEKTLRDTLMHSSQCPPWQNYLNYLTFALYVGRHSNCLSD